MTKRSNKDHDELDALLRQWHDVNAERAAAGRDELLARLGRERAARPDVIGRIGPVASFVRSAVMNRYSPIAAALLAAVVLITLLVPGPQGSAAASTIMVPEGGRLEALDDHGNVLGPCPLDHTDVDVKISGFLTRATVTQKYRNPYDRKIEAVYTFPLSHRAAVDRMTMTIGDRVVVGEVKERELARRIYEAAREQGYVASLLEQERPNIFTQSVANIEPGAEVIVEIGYVEVLASTDGIFTFDFPMVVAPRYIPGAPPASPSIVPAELTTREGLVLMGPAALVPTDAGDLTARGSLQRGTLSALIDAAAPIERPGGEWWGHGDATGGAGQPNLWYRFEAVYCDGSKELGALNIDGTGELNGRWFYADPAAIDGMGAGYAQDTDQVPDASRITPMPVRPQLRAGHDISVTVTIDTGGPGIVDVEAPLHEIVTTPRNGADGAPSTMTVALAAKSEIPNRDFVLSWRQDARTIEEATFVHTSGDLGDWSGGFFTMILQPPHRVDQDTVRPRELVFVMDVSGSMRGEPIEQSKAVMTRAIDAMRPGDTFNVITFAGRTAVLWDDPKPATAANRAAAKAFVESRTGGGGTEMMAAINTALVQEPSARLAGADAIAPMRIVLFLTDGEVGNDMAIIDAVKRNASTTRVFSFGIGNSVNRYLLENMARAGRGEVEFVLLASDPDEAVERFAKRVQTPVLTDIEVEFGDGLEVSDLLPAAGSIPDLFDARPLVIQGRYAKPGSGTVTIRGNTGAGPWQRVIDLDLPESQPDHDVIATIWARAKVDELLAPHLAMLQHGSAPEPARREVIALGEQFRIMTPFTSFVAVEKSRLTIGGKPVLVAVPIEMPDGMSYEGVFGGERNDKDGEERLRALGYLGYDTFVTAGVKASADTPSSGTAGLGRRAKGAKRDAPGRGTRGQESQLRRKTENYELDRAEPLLPSTAPGPAWRQAVDTNGPADALRELEGGASVRANETAADEERLGDVVVETETEEAPRNEVSEVGAGLQKAADEAKQQVIFARVLDAALFILLRDPDNPARLEGLPLLDGRPLITVLVAATDRATREALAKAGLHIEAVSESLPIIVGTIDPADLEQLAQVAGVRRIEPTRYD